MHIYRYTNMHVGCHKLIMQAEKRKKKEKGGATRRAIDLPVRDNSKTDASHSHSMAMCLSNCTANRQSNQIKY